MLSCPGGSFFTNLLTMSRVFAKYIQWTLLPIDVYIVIPDGQRFVSYSLLNPWVLLSLLVLVGVEVDPPVLGLEAMAQQLHVRLAKGGERRG